MEGLDIPPVTTAYLVCVRVSELLGLPDEADHADLLLLVRTDRGAVGTSVAVVSPPEDLMRSIEADCRSGLAMQPRHAAPALLHLPPGHRERTGAPKPSYCATSSLHRDADVVLHRRCADLAARDVLPVLGTALARLLLPPLLLVRALRPFAIALPVSACHAAVGVGNQG